MIPLDFRIQNSILLINIKDLPLSLTEFSRKMEILNDSEFYQMRIEEPASNVLFPHLAILNHEIEIRKGRIICYQISESADCGIEPAT
jgi:hypothetical protein